MAYILEVVVTSLDSAIAAERGGADRLELCVNLGEGGTGPPAELIQAVRDRVQIPVHVMVRPRSGDFCYDNDEFERMKADILAAKIIGADGAVLGILHPDRTVDIARSKELVRLARPMQTTFHRAFDETPDPAIALEDVVSTGATRVLTSGQSGSAWEGRAMIRGLVERAGTAITILAGAGITHENVGTLIHATGVREVHAARAVTDSRNRIVDTHLVKRLVAALRANGD